MIRYWLLLRRRSSFYVLNIVLPVLFLSLTTSAVFVLPAEAGEKIGMSITVLLAYSVYLSVIADQLPQTSVHVCYMQVYLSVLLGITALGVILSVAVLNMHHRSPETPVGRTLTRIIRRLRTCLWLEEKCNLRIPITNKVDCETESCPLENNKTKQVKKSGTTEVLSTTNILQENTGNDEISWSEVAQTLDRVFFIVFDVIIVMASVITLSYITSNGNGASIPIAETYSCDQYVDDSRSTKLF